MSEGVQDRVAKWLTYVVLLVIVIGGACLMYPNYRRGQSLRLQNAELQERIDRKKREIRTLIDNQRRFRSDADFVESIARQNHRVLPGEYIFIFNKD